ncbi:MAG: hypothetical protein PHQ23_14425 [Candidatus Wallbacteria bacterium]|nr:hypothetical protein [Candidatus Wallbacteria bacterium]
MRGICVNLISGYHRDLQLTKEPLMHAFCVVHSCLEVMRPVVDGLVIDEAACNSCMTEELYATERAYRLVSQGMPFREAYRQVARDLAEGVGKNGKKL